MSPAISEVATKQAIDLEAPVTKKDEDALASIFGEEVRKWPTEEKERFLQQLTQMRSKARGLELAEPKPAEQEPESPPLYDEQGEEGLPGELEEGLENLMQEQLVPAEEDEVGASEQIAQNQAELTPQKQKTESQSALDDFFRMKRKLGPFKSSRMENSDKKPSKAITGLTPLKKKGGRPPKPEAAKRNFKGRVPAGIRRMRTEPGAAQALEYLERYRSLTTEYRSKNKAREVLMKELSCSETFVKNLAKRESKLEEKAAEVGKTRSRKRGARE